MCPRGGKGGKNDDKTDAIGCFITDCIRSACRMSKTGGRTDSAHRPRAHHFAHPHARAGPHPHPRSGGGGLGGDDGGAEGGPALGGGDRGHRAGGGRGAGHPGLSGGRRDSLWPQRGERGAAGGAHQRTEGAQRGLCPPVPLRGSGRGAGGPDAAGGDRSALRPGLWFHCRPRGSDGCLLYAGPDPGGPVRCLRLQHGLRPQPGHLVQPGEYGDRRPGLWDRCRNRHRSSQ